MLSAPWAEMVTTSLCQEQGWEKIMVCDLRSGPDQLGDLDISQDQYHFIKVELTGFNLK